MKSIVTYDGDLDEARAGNAITVTLHDEVDLSRGDVLVGVKGGPRVGQAFDARLVWMHPEPLDAQKLYLLKHTTRTVRARVELIRHRVDVNTLAEFDATTLNMNDIGMAKVHTTLPLMFDAYQRIAAMGSFILIDPITNATVAAGMIARSAESSAGRLLTRSGKAVSADDRSLRFGHDAAAIWVETDNEIAEGIERQLFDKGCNVHLVRIAGFNDIELKAVARALHSAEVIAVFAAKETATRLKSEVHEIFGETRFLHVAPSSGEAVTAQVQEKVEEWRRRSTVERGQA